MELTTCLGNSIVLDIKSIYGDERLLDGDNSNVYHLDGAIVILARTFNSNNVAYANA